MEEAYAQALWRMVEGGTAPKKAVQMLHDSLVLRGRQGLMPKIIRAFERLATRERQAEGVVLSVGHEKDVRSAHRHAKDAIASIGATAKDVTVVVDDSLVGGWRLEGRETLIDGSFKNHLLNLYNRATR